MHINREKKIKQQRMLNSEESINILTAAERARTVDAKGEYIDHDKPRHSRRSTYPSNIPSEMVDSTSYGKRKKLEPLPPSLIDCSCSVCNSKQSFGALTLGKGSGCPHTLSQLTRYICRKIILQSVTYSHKMLFLRLLL